MTRPYPKNPPSLLKRAWRPAVLATAMMASVAAWALDASKPAAAVSAAASAPDAKRLAALCDTCAMVSGTTVEKRKGKATALGTAGGAVVGGVIGNKAGDGNVLATGAGAVAGGVIGREIEKRAKRHNVWVTTVTRRDGTTQKFEATADPHWQAGEVVRIENGALVKASAALK
jgi:outer membrane lipoprotein SlyB